MSHENWVERFVERVRGSAKTKCEVLVTLFLDRATPSEIAALTRVVKQMLLARREKKG